MEGDLAIVGVDIGAGSDFAVLHLIEYKNGEFGCNYIISNVKRKKIMTWEELEKIEAFLKENGYRSGGKPYHCNADQYWYKAFGKEDNPYEENRALWQVFINVYDWRKFQHRDPNLKDIGLTVTIHVSRTIDEVGITCNFDIKEEVFDLTDIEDKACNFWRYVEDNFGVPPKDGIDKIKGYEKD